MPSIKVKMSIGDKEIGEAEIGNVTRCPGRVSADYVWRINTTDNAYNPVSACGYIVDSYNGNAWQLLFEVLSEWHSGRKHPIDNHGFIRETPELIDISAEELWKRLDRIEAEKDKPTQIKEGHVKKGGMNPPMTDYRPKPPSALKTVKKKRTT